MIERGEYFPKQKWGEVLYLSSGLLWIDKPQVYAKTVSFLSSRHCEAEIHFL